MGSASSQQAEVGDPVFADYERGNTRDRPHVRAFHRTLDAERNELKEYVDSVWTFANNPNKDKELSLRLTDSMVEYVTDLVDEKNPFERHLVWQKYAWALRQVVLESRRIPPELFVEISDALVHGVYDLTNRYKYIPATNRELVLNGPLIDFPANQLAEPEIDLYFREGSPLPSTPISENEQSPPAT